MRILNKKLLIKFVKKNLGNKILKREVDKLLKELSEHRSLDSQNLKYLRPDADKIHSDGFYFFNISKERTMILIEFEENEGTIVWVGNHQQYTATFKNNKSTIHKWLKSRDWI